MKPRDIGAAAGESGRDVAGAAAARLRSRGRRRPPRVPEAEPARACSSSSRSDRRSTATCSRRSPSGCRSGASYPTDFNAYLRVHDNGRVTCLVGKVELGQGSKTTLAQLLADELDVAFDAVDMVMGDTDQCPWDMGTFGSLTVRQFGPVLRAAAAEARGVLLQLAAERLQVPVAQLQVRTAWSPTRRTPGRTVSYAELTRGQRIERHLEPRPAPKPHTALKVIGSAPRRKDALEKVTGRAKYAGDQLLPGRCTPASSGRPPTAPRSPRWTRRPPRRSPAFRWCATETSSPCCTSGPTSPSGPSRPSGRSSPGPM